VGSIAAIAIGIGLIIEVIILALVHRGSPVPWTNVITGFIYAAICIALGKRELSKLKEQATKK